MAFVPVYPPGYSWGVSTSLEKVAAAFPLLIRDRKEHRRGQKNPCKAFRATRSVRLLIPFYTLFHDFLCLRWIEERPIIG